MIEHLHRSILNDPAPHGGGREPQSVHRKGLNFLAGGASRAGKLGKTLRGHLPGGTCGSYFPKIAGVASQGCGSNPLES